MLWKYRAPCRDFVTGVGARADSKPAAQSLSVCDLVGQRQRFHSVPKLIGRRIFDISKPVMADPPAAWLEAVRACRRAGRYAWAGAAKEIPPGCIAASQDG